MSRRVEIRHPGYRPPNIIFSLPANDGPACDQVHYATVYAAGAVFTEQHSGLWLSSHKSGEPRIEPDHLGLIPAGEYFLHVTQTGQVNAVPYAITANFRAWRFPTGPLLHLWQKAAQDDSNIETIFTSNFAPESCRITKRRLACETAHIIPASEKAWFTKNEMDRYGRLAGRSGEAVADSPSNQMRLTRDAHWLWDNYHFSVIPREVPEEPGKVAWFTQMLGDDEELFQHWHYKKLQPLQGRSAQYMFARFAWDIFPRLHAFLQAGEERRLSVLLLNGKRETRKYSPSQCRQFSFGQGRGRSASPTKRTRQEIEESHERGMSTSGTDKRSDACSFDSAVADVDCDTQVSLQCDGVDPIVAIVSEESRGRKRQRSFDV